MKNMKGCTSTQIHQLSTSKNRRHPSAGTFYTSSAGAVISLILMVVTAFILSLTGATNLFGLNGSAYADYTISMTSSGAQSINVSPDASSVGTSISVDAVTVTTTCPAGYNLTTTTSVNDNKLYLNGSSSNNASGTYFNPSDGTTALSNATNTWGFYQNGSTVPTASSVFKPVPISTSTPATIRTSSSTSDSFNIYYGVAVGNDLAPGTYKMIPNQNTNENGTVVYYLTMSNSCLPYTVVFNPTSTAGGTPISGTGTMGNQSIPVGVATPLNTNTYTAPSGYVFDSWNTSQDGTGTKYTNGQTVTDLTTGSQTITLYAQWKEPDPCEGHENELYCKVKAQSKGKQTLAELRTAIDASNSGVYEYNSSVFGTASDAANTSKIYYYRGILDNTVGSYGSDGDNAKYPNTVVLSSASSKSGLTTSDTCWRIVRTTGSGGVKMIYQGKWTAAGDSGNCKNSISNANAVPSSYFNRRSSSATNYYDTKGRVIYVGYNFSSTASHQTDTSSVPNSTLFVNGTKSNLRNKLESWYNSNMTAWTSKLEGSAGWCNDRTTYSDTTTSTKTTSNTPYLTSSAATVYFGPYIRNRTTNSQPTLGCPNDTGYDLLTTSNGYIGAPSAPLTADEAAFAGSGYDSSTTPYHANSYLRSGANFWLLSPFLRNSSGNVYELVLYSDGSLRNRFVSETFGVRPAISLKPGSMAVNGSGTATDPWIVDTSVSPNPYCTDASTCMQNTTNPPACGTTMTDGRDGATYTTATIAGTCWMTQNLRFQGTDLKAGESDVTTDTTMTYGQLTSGDSYTEPRIATGSTTDYGTYYNFCAASAGEVCNNTTKQDATRSICPAGWKLPTQAQLNAVPQKDSHFTASSGLAGRYLSGTLNYAGSLGGLWASTGDGTTTQCSSYYDKSADYWDIGNYFKYRGISIRCVRAS